MKRSKEDGKILDALAALGESRITADELVYEGKRLVLPETWTPKKAVSYLEDHIEAQEQETQFSREFRFRPWDGAHAVQLAFKRVFGTVGIQKPITSLFGEIPPEQRTIPVAVNETAQVPWGQLQVPLFEGTMSLAMRRDPDDGPLFVVGITAPKKYSAHVEGLFEAIQHELETNSIYRGMAIDGSDDPEFLDLSSVDEDKIVYSQETHRQLDANIWSAIQHADKMRELGVSLKRAVLLEGPYGTGKTLAAFMTAKHAVANGWTFLYCRPGQDDIHRVMQTAKLYQPAVVFFEDVDTIADPDEHGVSAVSKLLDTFDGLSAKGTELLAVMTTNHADRIHKGMVRPGRLDAVVHIGALDTPGVEKLVRANVPSELLSNDLDWDLISTAMDGYLPAFMVEATTRAMRYNIARHKGDVTKLDTEDFVAAANGLRDQLALMDEAQEHASESTIDAQFKALVDDSVGSQVRRALSESSLYSHSRDEITHEVEVKDE